MRKLLLLALLGATLTSCKGGGVEDICEEAGDCFYQDNLIRSDHPYYYAQLFLLDMRRRGITENRFPDTWRRGREGRGAITFRDLDGADGRVQMYCNTSNMPSPLTIHIDRDFWRGASDAEKIFIVYHEMAHYVFGMDHYSYRGGYPSIMQSGRPSRDANQLPSLVLAIKRLFGDYRDNFNYVGLCRRRPANKGDGIGFTCQNAPFTDDLNIN